MAKVRVIIPTYNRASLVDRAIESVLKQTFGNFEVIVSNDGSTDGTEEVVQKLADGDSRIRIITSSNGGAAQARNRAIEFPGEYEFIAFLDDDDLWYPHHLEHSIDFMNSCPNVNFVFARVKTIDLTGTWSEKTYQRREERMRKPIEFSTTSPMEGCYILNSSSLWQAMLNRVFAPHPSTVVVRRGAVSRTCWFDPTLEVMEDAEFVLHLIRQGATFGFLDSTYAEVHYQGDNLTGGLQDMSSPILTRRLESVLRWQNMKLGGCADFKERKIVYSQISRTAYLLGQSHCEQGNSLSARRFYFKALTYKLTWSAFKGFILSCLPFPLWNRLKELKA